MQMVLGPYVQRPCAAADRMAHERVRAPVALVLARYFIGMLVGGVAVLWVAAWYYLRKPRGAHTLHPCRGCACRPCCIGAGTETCQCGHINPAGALGLQRGLQVRSETATAALVQS